MGNMDDHVEIEKDGWHWLPSQKHAHVFRAGQSLCGKVEGQERPELQTAGAQNPEAIKCVECKKLRRGRE